MSACVTGADLRNRIQGFVKSLAMAQDGMPIGQCLDLGDMVKSLGVP